MALRTYATESDYAEYAEEPWDDSSELLLKRLRAASVEIERLTRRAIYDADTDGYPTDAGIAEAFTEATCAIVEYWGITDDPTGAESAAGAVKIASVSLGTTSSNQDGLSPMERLQRRIGSRGVDILSNAGLIGSAVAHT